MVVAGSRVTAVKAIRPLVILVDSWDLGTYEEKRWGSQGSLQSSKSKR